MAKTKTPSTLSLADIPTPRPCPEVIKRLRGDSMHDTTIDGWNAANTLHQAIDVILQWYRELANTGDADPVVITRLLEDCRAAIFTLASIGAFPGEFRNCEPDNLVELLPSPPFPFRMGWQEVAAQQPIDASRLRELQGAVSAVLSQLERQPTVATGWKPDDNKGEEGAGSPSAIEWTRPMNKKEAARKLDCEVKNKSRWIDDKVKGGKLKIHRLSREMYQFNLDAFSPEMQEELKSGRPN